MERYELATLSVARSTASLAAQGVAPFVAAGSGAFLGCWIAETGALNAITVMRGFRDDAELMAERERTLRSGDPFGCGGHLTGMVLDSYAPFPFLPPVQPGAFGPVYEIRSYALAPGGLGPVLDGWEAGLPARTAYSKLLVALYALHGEPRITHIWPYADLNERARVRAQSVRSGAWPPKTSAWLTRDMRATICLPAAGSPLS